MWDVLQLEFMRHAVIAGLLAALACGIIGPMVVVNRLVFLSGGIAHAAYGGIGLAFYLGLAPFLGALGFSLLTAVIMALVTYRNRHHADTIIGALWAVGMATGVILIDLTPGYNVDLMSYLFGSILAVPSFDLKLMAGLDIIIAGVILGFYKEYLALSYDEEFALAMGLPVRGLYFLLLVLIAMAVVMLIRVVGLVLVIALLTMPSYIAEKCTRSLAMMMFSSIVLCALFTLTGLALSFSFNLTSGATIIMITSLAFFLFIGFNSVKRWLAQRF